MWGSVIVALAAVMGVGGVVWPEDGQWRGCRNDLHCTITSYGEAAKAWNSISRFGDSLQLFGNMLACLAALPEDCSPLIPIISWDPYKPAAKVASKLEQLRVSTSMGIITMDSEELKEELVSPWDFRVVGEAKECFEDVVRTLEECRVLAEEGGEGGDTFLTVDQTKHLLDSLRTVATSCKALAS